MADSDTPTVCQRRFCLGCNDELPPAGAACPRCGHPFDPARSETFAAGPRFLAWRFWLPGFCLSVASGVIAYAIGMRSGVMGWALFLGVPVSFGAILGYATNTRVWWLLVLLGGVIPAVIMSLIMLNAAGIFCGLTLGMIFLLPASIGVLLGMVLRAVLRRSSWDQRWFLPLLLIGGFPYAAQYVESSLPREARVTTVSTSLTLDATADEAWRAIQMYEDVKHEPRGLLKLALPRPIRTIGPKSRPGDVVQCIYDRGRLCKRITEAVPGRRLAFVVIEQELQNADYARLIDGSFELTDAGAGRTKVTLTTRYEELLAPEAFWGPMERKVIHALHEHILEGMRR